MSVVSAGDQTKYANAKQTWCDPVLNVEPLDELATALVNQSTFTYPLLSLTVDNTSADWGDVVENMMFRIEEPGGRIICWGVTRKDATANTFYPDVKSDGDFGYATNEGITIENNDVVRVYRNRHIWAMVSRVADVAGTITQFKRWDQAYTSEGTTPPPVCIMGHDQQSYIDTGTNLATFAFDASDSYGWTSGETISTFAYTLPTGAVVTGGAINTDSVTFTIAAGIHIVQLDITSSTGITRSGFRTIYANDTSSNKSFGENFSFEAIPADSTGMFGWEGQFTVLGDVSGVVFPGCKCHWYVPVYYDGSRLTDNDAFIDVFVGYLSEIRVQADENRVKRTTLTFKSPLQIGNMLPSATQTFEEVTTASKWTEVVVGLSDPAYAAYYVLNYHTTICDSHDFLHESDIRDLRRRVFGFPADNINAHLQLDGQILRGNVGCRSDGTITVTQEPSLQNTADRNARDSKFTWTEDSVRSRLTLAPRFRPQIAYLIMGAVAYDGNQNNPMIAYAAKAPGNAQAQGVTKTNIPDISITVSGGAAELYGVVGHMFAFLNNPLDKLDVPVSKMFEIADPADPDWHVLNISETTYLPITLDLFGVRWTTTMRMRPTRVTRQWAKTNGSWNKTIMQQNRVESSSRAGVFHPTYKGELQPWINPSTGWNTGLDIVMPDVNIEFDSIAGGLPTSGDWNVGWAYNDFGLSGYASDANGVQPTYVSTATALTGDVVGQTLEGDGGGAAYLTTGHDNQIEIFVDPDIDTDPTDWTSEISRTLLINYSQALVYANMITDTETTMLIFQEPQKVTTISQEIASPGWVPQQVGSTATASDPNSGLPAGCAVGAGTDQWASGREEDAVAAIAYRVFSANLAGLGGGSWTAIANHPGSGYSFKPIPMIARGGTNIYVTHYTTAATPKLYRIDDATTTWTDITPAGDYVPLLPNAFSISGTNIQMIGTDPDGNARRWSSTNSGTNWTDNGTTPYDWLKRLSSDSVFALGGNNLLDFTNDGFITFHSRLGGWASIGSIGVMQDYTSLGLF